MLSGFIAQKGRMENRFLENGRQIAVTCLTAAPLKVTQIKTIAKDGYSAVQVAYGYKKNQLKPVADKLKKLKINLSPSGFTEFKPIADQPVEIGADITVDTIFNVGDIVRVTGTTKGRGFAGVIKRHGFHRQPVSGGQSDRVRAPGAIGAQTPGKVVKGKKMPGHYGNATKTISHLKVIAIDKESHQLIIAGPVPGHLKSWLLITK